jgi:transposase
VATIVARRVKGMKEPAYYYHRSYRVKVSPADTGKGPGSGPSRVRTEDVYLGTAEDIRAKCRQAPTPQTIKMKAFGRVAAALAMVGELGIVQAVDRLVPKRHQGLSVGTYVALGVVAKVCAPEVSWNRFGAWVQKTILPEHMDLPPALLDAQNFWDHWDLMLPEHSVRMRNEQSPLLDDETVLGIEEAIWQRVVDTYHVPLDCVLYDATNFLTFLGPQTPAQLPQVGKSKEGRNQLRIVGLALAATRELGLPLLALVFEGNCHEARLFPESVARLVQRITRLHQDAEQLLLVFDKGQNSKSNLQWLHDIKVDAVGSLVASHHRKLLAVPLRRYTARHGDLLVYSSEREVHGLRARVVLTYNAKLAERQERTFRRQLQQAEQALRTHWQRHRSQPVEQLRTGLAAVIRKQRAGRFWQVAVTEGNELHLRADSAARRQRRLEFGKRLLFTTRLAMTAEQVLETYNRDKARVEDDFRSLKDPDLVRFQPIRHWTDSKIRIYALICVLALLVIKLMGYKAKQAGLDMSQVVLGTELADIQEAYVLYDPMRVVRTLTHMSEVQRRLFTVLGLQPYAPGQASERPLQSQTG